MGEKAVSVQTTAVYTPLKLGTGDGIEFEEEGDANDPCLPKHSISAVHEKKAAFRRLVTEAQNHPEYGSIFKSATVPEDVPNDVWGAMIFTIVVDLPDLRAGRAVIEGKVRFVFIMSLFVINVFIQGILVYYIASLLLLPDMQSAQDVYKSFHDRAFSDGKLNQEGFDGMSSDEKQHLCGMALSQVLFVRVILFLWVTMNFGELRDNMSQVRATMNVPRLPDQLDTRLMVRDLSKESEGGGEFCIVCLNMKGKVGLCLLVFIPKFLIAIALLVIGSVWLATASSVGDLILNSLALAFVVKVDELFAVVFFPQRLQKDIATLNFMCPADASEADEDQRSRNITAEIMWCVALVMSAAAVVEALIAVQPVIPFYDRDVTAPCVAYLDKQVPWCLPWMQECFPTA